ncbi:MAG: iron-sulfur cluster assembly scaffold protein [Candidatus Eisenbacteria sp.]|nr:iron-sulfur cluster assembly scaffold protein [Candidatus Eisenbacteria bacterium]
MSDFEESAKALQEQIIEQAREEYSEVVIEHWLHPRNPYAMDNPDGHGRVKGPCGDTMDIFIRVTDGKITDASFVTDGCITSVVSGSMAVEMATGRDVSEARAISKDDILNALGGLPEVSQHCALLASNTLRAAVDNYMF